MEFYVMKHVFISYSSVDGDFADLLRLRLEQEGFTVWTDNGNLVAGDDWRDEIDQAIRDAFAVIVVMTPNSRSSQYVTFEWSFALGIGNVKVIPLLKEVGGDTHPRIDPLQRLDFRNRKTNPCNDLFDLLRKSSSAGIAGSGAATGRAASTTPSVEILTPVPGESVDFRQTVQGTVYPTGSSVQVLIHSLDDFWN